VKLGFDGIPAGLLPYPVRGTKEGLVETTIRFLLYHSKSTFELLMIIFFQNLSVPTPKVITFFHSFSTTASVSMAPNHTLFKKVSWDRVSAGYYACVDPMNPSSILYLSEADYIVTTRVLLTAGRTMVVLAQPGDNPLASSSSTSNSSTSSSSPTSFDPTDPSSKNTPPQSYPPILGSDELKYVAKKTMKFLFSSVFTNEGWRKGGDRSMITLSSGNIGKWLFRWAAKLHWWAKGSTLSVADRKELRRFRDHLLLLYRTQGVNAVINRLKIYLFTLNSYLGGEKMTSTEPLGLRVRLSSGLPAALPAKFRARIRGGDIITVRIIASIFNSYKALNGLYGKIPLSTITQAHPVLENLEDFVQFTIFCKEFFWDQFIFRYAPLSLYKPDLTVKQAFVTPKAGPNHPSALLGAAIDAYAWTLQPENHLLKWLQLTGQTDLALRFRKDGRLVPLEQYCGFPPLKPLYGRGGRIKKWIPVSLSDLVLGRLHALYEPAGKIRVIAIVDYWTQMVLKPLHDWMFKLLENIPMDATFDQEGKVKSFAEKGFSEIYSFDLSAATDTIPLELYRTMMSVILPPDVVDLWLKLLVDRDFVAPRELQSKPLPKALKHESVMDHAWMTKLSGLSEDDIKAHLKGIGRLNPELLRVRYGTGQPMGALSSWAALALVHHALVQFAAWRVGEFPYTGYLVLGDDVIIAGGKVGWAYYHICSSFSILIKLFKSFKSFKGMFNFANQTYVGRTNVSPLSLREEVGITSLPARTELFCRALRRGWIDLQTSGWLGKVIKYFVSPAVWQDITLALREGRQHPVVTWVLSVLFAPSTGKLAWAGLQRVSIWTYMAAMRRDVSLWSRPFIGMVSPRRVSDEMHAVSIFTRLAKDLYAEFLRTRSGLTKFETWVILHVPKSLDYILKRIYQEGKAKAFEQWSTDYRKFVKTYILAAEAGADLKLLEFSLRMPFEAIVEKLLEAREAFPRIPDFDHDSLEAIISRVSSKDVSLDKFLRAYRVHGYLEDHLSSFMKRGSVRRIDPTAVPEDSPSERSDGSA